MKAYWDDWAKRWEIKRDPLGPAGAQLENALKSHQAFALEEYAKARSTDPADYPQLLESLEGYFHRAMKFWANELHQSWEKQGRKVNKPTDGEFAQPEGGGWWAKPAARVHLARFLRLAAKENPEAKDEVYPPL